MVDGMIGILCITGKRIQPREPNMNTTTSSTTTFTASIKGKGWRNKKNISELNVLQIS